MISSKFILVAVITLDGKIAKNSKHQSNWSSKEDKIFLHKKIKECDVIIVGKNTYTTSYKPLSKKNCIIFTKSVNQTKKKSDLALYVNPSNVDLKTLIKKLGYKKVCILGGAQTYSLMLKQKLIDEIFITIEPIVFGTGLNLFDIKTPKTIFKLNSIKKLNKRGAILLHYKK